MSDGNAAYRPRAERPGQDSLSVSRRAGRVRSSEWLGTEILRSLVDLVSWPNSQNPENPIPFPRTEEQADNKGGSGDQHGNEREVP